MSLLPVDEALARMLDGAAPKRAEMVALADAGGRVLAAPVAALRTQPPFPASAMDGYAVRAEDVAAVPARLRVIGEAPAGAPFAGTVGPGDAVRIFTGAPVPEGADAVLIQENTKRDGAHVEVLESVARGRNIRRAGLDFEHGEPLLPAGRVLDPAALSLVAAANHATVSVVERPLVAVIATGDELVAPGSNLGPGQIVASNATGVAALAREAGAEALDLGIARDERPAIAAKVRDALAAGADVIVTLGGASVGDHDLVHEVLAGEGMQLDFWKIAMRPGKPLMFGRLGATRVIGLPGNPVSSMVCSVLFLKPLLLSLAGRPPAQTIREARLTAPMPENDTRQDYVRAAIVENGGDPSVTPFVTQDSSMLKVFAEANGLIIRPPFAPPAAAGETVKVLMLR
ncbi:MAG: molybdopterin molybdotransferase MoeA [Rhizobiaceae bacterium]|nr:molybdopterin molybdotransferase MoeA [Rhizobiaceae bacterium]